MTMTDAEVRAVADALFDKLRPVVEQAIAQHAQHTQRPAPSEQWTDTTGRLTRFVTRAQEYAGPSRYGQICAKGLMPRSHLLRLMRLKANDFYVAINQATQAGLIEACCDPDSGLACYRPTTQTAAKQPVEAVMAALDNPAQDSHTWDFATAVKQAKEREWWAKE